MKFAVVGGFRASAILAALFALVLGGCGGGGCGALGLAPFPAGVKVPADQTVEGAVQVRVTKSGFKKLTDLVPGFLNGALNSACVPPIGSGLSGTPPAPDCLYVQACYQKQCGGNATGCTPDVTIKSLSMAALADAKTFRIDTTFDATIPNMPIRGAVACLDKACTITPTVKDAHVIADIAFATDATTGELTVKLKGLPKVNLSGFSSTSDCGFIVDAISGGLGALLDLLSSSFGNTLVNLLTPVIDGFVQKLLPKPLGIEGLLDVGKLLSSFAPGVDATLEARAVAGGYVSLPAEGLSVGLIVGVNSDRDRNTRDAARDSEPSLCVPQRPAPDFAAAPASLPKTSRGTFALLPAGEFLGTPDPASDVALGVSETVMDLAGYHAISSGAMCLGVGSSTIPQLNVGTIGLIAPSLSSLSDGSGTGKEPVMIVLRPQQPLDFSIGEETDTDPRIGIHIRDMEADMYVWAYERYTRAFTISLTLDVGVNIEFTTVDGKAAIQPVLLGLDASKITVKVSNADILAEDPAELEALFPTLLDLVVPLLGDALGSFVLPEIGGFRLENLQDSKIVTSQDDFLGIYATMAPGTAALAAGAAFVPETIDREIDTTARVVRVTTPTADVIRAGLRANDPTALPAVELDIGGVFTDGASSAKGIEWQWRLDGGMWRTYSRELHPVLRDRAFAIQGRHDLEIRAREVGDFRSFDRSPIKLPIVIDSVGPDIFMDRVHLDGDAVVFPATDLVSEDATLVWSIASATDSSAAPRVLGTVQGRLPIADLEGAAAKAGDGLVAITVSDEKGNATTQLVDLADVIVGFHGRTPPAAGGGCGCHVGDGGDHSHDGGLAAGLLGVLFAMALGLRGRTLGLARLAARGLLRASRTPSVLLALIAALAPGCSCSDDAGADSCAVNEDCAAQCTGPTAPLCLDNMCFCADDIPLGQIGPHSDVGVSSGGGPVWVSAYNVDHGDLMVAQVTGPGRVGDDEWEFVDGVPDGPVAIPTSKVRGGISEPGDDVGRYTSIAATASGDALVSYYDTTNGSLRFAGRYGTAWQKMVVDQGQPINDELGGEEAGRYTSLTVSPVDATPAIAYQATIYDGANGRTEVRVAMATVPQPSQTSDWKTYVVESAALPVLPDGKSPPADLPEGTGFFTASARLADGSPVVAYYDRTNGDLKLSWFDATKDAFADPIVVDGADGEDVGWYPSLAITPDGVIHVSYVDALHDNLLYATVGTDHTPTLPVVVDDGYRVDGQTSDGLPKPGFHLVGDDSSIVNAGGKLVIAYQDATSHELLLADRDATTSLWGRATLAGAADPFVGAYGFYTAAEFDGQNVVVSSFANNLKDNDAWVEIFYGTAVQQ